MIKAVIFDFDDTMVDSEPLHQKAWDLLLANYGFKLKDIPIEKRKKFIGMKSSDVARDIVSSLKIAEDPQSFYQKKAGIFMDLVRSELKPLNGLINCLNFLHEANYTLAIATSGVKQYVNFVLNSLELFTYFKVIVTAEDVIYGKPDPEIYVTASKKLNLKPSECLVIEDATNGIIAAKKADCKCVAVRNSNTLLQDLSYADLVIDSLNKLNSEIINSL